MGRIPRMFISLLLFSALLSLAQIASANDLNGKLKQVIIF